MEPKRTVAAIVRDPASLEAIRAAMAPADIAVAAAPDAEQGWDLIHRARAGVILLDDGLPGSAALLERIAGWDPGAHVLLLTGRYSPEVAVQGIERGACDCIGKPFAPETLRRRVAELLSETRLRRETQEIDERLVESFQFQGMVGRSPRMLDTFDRVRRVAPHYRIALISGPTGTGKELVAQALHALSPVAARRFVVCNCSAIVETLFESELFGHVKGAFTGATQDRAGFFEYAQGGAVFLDEIADMPLAAQSKLLRVVQNQELQRVGSPAVRQVDVRVIAATNRDVRALVARNLFREDLYYRLSMVELRMPPLAERREDLPLLERHFVRRFAQSYGKRVAGISRRAQAVLSRHGWPGNVRELENVLGHACMMAESEFIDVRDLPEYLRGGTGAAAVPDPELMPLAGLDRRYAQYVLERVGGNKLRAAQILGIGRATLYRILRGGESEPDQALVDFLGRASAGARLRIQ